MLEIELIRHVKVDGQPALYGCTDILAIKSENERLLSYLVAQQATPNKYQHIVCSPLLRCQMLANELSARCQLPLTILPDLQEMNFGCFDGVAFDDIVHDVNPNYNKNSQRVKPSQQVKYTQQSTTKKEMCWSLLEAFFNAPATTKLPQAESLADFNQRVISTWQTLLVNECESLGTQNSTTQPPESIKAQQSKRILVIAHGGVIRMILAHIMKIDWQQPSWYQNLHIGYGSLTKICVSQPFKNTQQAQLHQQVTTIAMPLIKGSHCEI